MQAHNIVVYHCGLIGLPVEDFSVHSTRRGLGSEATANGVPEIVTMNELGHASYDTFADYVSLRGDEAVCRSTFAGMGVGQWMSLIWCHALGMTRPTRITDRYALRKPRSLRRRPRRAPRSSCA